MHASFSFLGTYISMSVGRVLGDTYEVGILFLGHPKLGGGGQFRLPDDGLISVFGEALRNGQYVRIFGPNRSFVDVRVYLYSHDLVRADLVAGRRLVGPITLNCFSTSMGVEP